MSELIDRQAAIDALDFEIVHMTAYCDGKNEGNPLAQYNKGLEDGKKAIKALPPAQPEPQWISVSERLPEESEYYIITASDGVGHRTTFAKFQKKAKSWDLTGARSYWKVIAWMPLPTPYTK